MYVTWIGIAQKIQKNSTETKEADGRKGVVAPVNRTALIRGIPCGAASRRRRRSYRALTIKQIGAIYRVLGTPTTSLSHPHP